MTVSDTFHALVGDLEPVAAEAGSDRGEFMFHRAMRIDAGHPA